MVAPLTYWKASKAEKKRVCNGCGAKGWKGKLVPETIWGCCVTPACNVHDWMYEEGGLESHKETADEMFLANMLALIDEYTDWKFIKWLRGQRARTYYKAVKKMGESYFKYKNPLV